MYSVRYTGGVTYIILILDPQNLFSEVSEVIEGCLGGDGVHQHKPLAVLHVQVTHSSELFLE